MTNYFPQNNWEAFAYKRLNQLIDQYKSESDTPKSSRHYVVFDFDNTSVIGDVEDNNMMYMAEHLLYKISPERFLEILTSGPFDVDYVLNIANPGMSPRNMALDIMDDYQWLWDNYINATNPITLEEAKDSMEYQSFRAKIRYYYLWVNKLFTRQSGQPWLTYWFEGYTQEELIQHTKAMIDWAIAQEPKVHTFESPWRRLGRSGIIESQFTSGLAFPQELLDLYAAFQANGIETYVVSASPIDIVRTAAVDYGFNVPYDQVVAMEYTFNDNGQIQAVMAPDSFITKREGKTEAIQARIMPLQEGKEPIALFGDSMGDYHMMRNFEGVKLNVLFNCLASDDTRLLVNEASDLYDVDEAKIVIQGRDENKLSLLPQRESIGIGLTDAQLTLE